MNKRKHYKSNLTYHIIICPKYRHRVLHNKLKDFLTKQIYNICKRYNYEILDFSIEIDHVHLVITVEPTYSISSVISKIKFISGYNIFKQFKSLRKKYFWDSGFWSHGYFVSSIGNVSKNIVMEYIKNQENYEEK